MSKQDLEGFALEAVKHMKTEKDLRNIIQMLTKINVAAALNGELDVQLGYESIKKRLCPIAVMATPSNPLHLNG